MSKTICFFRLVLGSKKIAETVVGILWVTAISILILFLGKNGLPYILLPIYIILLLTTGYMYGQFLDAKKWRYRISYFLVTMFFLILTFFSDFSRVLIYKTGISFSVGNINEHNVYTFVDIAAVVLIGNIIRYSGKFSK